MLAIRINITIFAVDIHQIRQCGLNFNIIQPKERLTLSLQQDTNTHNRFMKANDLHYNYERRQIEYGSKEEFINT